MKKIGIAANCKKKRAPEILLKLSDRISKLGMDLVVDETTAGLFDGADVLSIEEMAKEVDVIIALGGDGTMLRVVREMASADTPVMGFNIGSLGFMTSVAEEDFDRALKCLAEDDYIVSERAVMDCTVRCGDGCVREYRALNDVVIKSGASARMANVEVSIDDETIASYACDGLIISTPTGSTGHSLSSGGPILSPETEAFVISPICPHTLSSRPLVVRSTSSIAVKPIRNASELLLVIDGQTDVAVGDDDLVIVGKSDRSVRFIHLSDYSYFNVLRQKLRWSESNR